jgi:type IV secretion system protein VirB1
MEAADITTLIDRCTAPTLARPVAAIMRQASEFEPLLVTIAGKRPIRVLADTKPEAIALTSEAAAAGQPVRIGLAQLDVADLKAAGLTIAAAFDPCEHIAGVGRVFQERKALLVSSGLDDDAASERARTSFKAGRTAASPVAAAKPDTISGRETKPAGPDEEIASAKDPPSWSVYGAQRGSSLLIYSH